MRKQVRGEFVRQGLPLTQDEDARLGDAVCGVLANVPPGGKRKLYLDSVMFYIGTLVGGRDRRTGQGEFLDWLVQDLTQVKWVVNDCLQSGLHDIDDELSPRLAQL